MENDNVLGELTQKKKKKKKTQKRTIFRWGGWTTYRTTLNKERMEKENQPNDK